MKLVLGSSSPFRRALLDRLQLEYRVVKPHVDETPMPDESPLELVKRLSLAKAQKVAENEPNALIIGCDQVAVLNGEIMGKPADHDQAMEQLSRCSGKNVSFLSGLCLLNSDSGDYQLDVVPFAIQYKTLSRERIENYLRKDQPYQCAGSIKSESLGIVLFKSMHGDDPTSLMGLPLIRLTAMLEKEGVLPLAR